MRVFSVVGTTKSGKTSTIEAIIPELRCRGYSVGSVKDIHFKAFAIDQEGTNTHRHRMAGSQLVTAWGLHETDVMFPERLPLEKVLSYYDHDFVVLEGAYDFYGPGIITAHNEAEIEARIRPGIFAICGQISNHLEEYRGLPVVNALTESTRLADIIEQSVADWELTPAARQPGPHLGRQPGVERLPSKKNDVYRFGDVVIKRFTDSGRFEMETEIGSLLENSGLNTPPRLAVNPLALTNIYRFVEALPVVELIETVSWDQATAMLDKIWQWMQDFYILTLDRKGIQYILGDVHLRNFLYRQESQQIYGLDFEECRPGRIETDLARFYVFLLHYDPALTPRKRALGAYWLELLAGHPMIGHAFLHEEMERESAAMKARRQRRIISADRDHADDRKMAP